MSPRRDLAQWLQPRPIPLAVLQFVGLVCLIVSAWAIRDGWYALGIFGLALLTIAELARRYR